MLQGIKPLLDFLQWVRVVDRFQCRAHQPHKTYEQAALDLIDKDTETKRKRRVSQNLDFEGVHPQIVEFWQGMKKECEKRNISVRAFEFVRSMDKQEHYYKTGRTNSPAGRSAHNIGGLGLSAAVDIISTEKAWKLTKKEWDILISIGNEVARKKKIKIYNGSKFKKLYDPAHWQLKDWLKYRDAADYCAEKEITIQGTPQQKWVKLEYIDKLINETRENE